MTPSSGRAARTLLPAALVLTACSFSGSVTATQSRTSGTAGSAGSAAASSTGASTGSGSTATDRPTSGSPSARPGSSGGSGTTAPAGSTAPRTDRCHTSELTGSLVAESSGAGQRYATLVLRNSGGHTCTVHGYGGLGLAGSDGRALPTSQVRTGGPATTVPLAPGVSVSSALHWSAVPGAADAPSGPCQPDPATLRVIPPDETDALSVTWPLGPVCSGGTIEQHPYAP